tara:strand:- start:336 stop:1118 length:783 start_codon:yes stop_codon:yes gene_type:complete
MPDILKEQISIRNQNLHFTQTGEGPVVLFLHGAGAAGSNPFEPMLERLNSSFHVIVPEHPGYGYSDKPDWIKSIPDVAYFYLDFLEQMDLSDIHLIGNSMGGWIACEIAIRNTQRLQSLTLIGSVGINIEGVSPPMYLFDKTPEEIMRLALTDEKIIEELLSIQPSEEQEKINARNMETAAQYVSTPYSDGLHNWLHRIDVPTLILAGDGDDLVSPEYLREFEKRIPNSKMSILEDCGHIPSLERPDLLNSVFREFVGNL